MLGFQITQQALFYGAVSGLTYAVLAAGFVLVYRSTGVLNFAQGEIGAFGVAIIGLLAAGYDIPYWPSFFLAVAASVLISVVVEMTVVRRLSKSSRLVLLIATIGLAQLLFAARLLLPDAAAAEAFPLPFDVSWQLTDSILVVSREVLVLLVAPVTILGLALFMTKTRFGLMVRASAANPDTARVFGISVKTTSTIVWAIAGGFAAVTAIMIAPIQGITPGSAVRAGTAAIGPSLMVRALVVALIARMRSLPLTLVGGLAVGIFEAVVRANVDRNNQSIVDLWLFLAAVVLVLFWVRGQRDPAAFSLSARVKPIPERLLALWYIRHLTKIGFGLLFGALAILPFFLDRPSQDFLWTDVLIFAMVALPLSMLLGWAGQFSLGQFAFVGVGAVVTVMVTHDHDIPVPFDLFDLHLQVPWGVAVLLATAVGVVAALLIGLPALRVHGLFLAVITFAFSVAAASWLFDQGAFTGSEFATRTPFMVPPVVGGIDFSDRRSFYFLCLACLALMTALMARVRRTGLGRSMIAVNENEDMAAASTISATRMKLVAFAISGGMAAFAGALFITLRVELNPTEAFTPDDSLRMIATAVIGGLGSVAGPIIGALFVRGLPVAFGDVEEVRLLTSAVGLLLLLMYFPGGLMQIVYAGRDAVLGWADRRLTAKEPAAAPAAPAEVPVRSSREIAVPEGAPWLRLDDLRVRFGGITAVDGVSLAVDGGELVGIIGTNGAGKSTLMNAISGFVPSSGTIEVLGRDVNGLPPHKRHLVGMGRGFQAARLYPELTVRETIMVALEARERSLVVPSMTGLPPSPGRERRKRAEATELIDFVGLGAYAEQFVANLSTGTRRIVELSCLVAADAKLLLLDEPTGGVAQRETEAFGPLIVSIRRELGAAMVVIEHDMPLIMGISDRVYCLEAGRVIAEGSPDAVRNDPLVVASYLGTDERVIQRSGAVAVGAAPDEVGS
ncbi:MAG: ATP-binding cassette domain-containing protein [Acidimicrobiales bacterium]|nr:ATP-binding cassette domain-containing protein [Acidimicrobiales bacterium]